MHRITRLSLVASAATLVLPAAATAAPVAATSATVHWSQTNIYGSLPARTFLGHTTNPGSVFQGKSNGTAVASDGATLLAPDGSSLTEVGPSSPRGTGEVFTFGFPGTSGTIDRAAKTVKVQAKGAITFVQYPALTPSPPAPIKISDLVVELRGTTGAVYADVTGPTGGAADYPTTPEPLFSLNAANAQTLDLGNGRVVISGLVPTLQRVNVFGSAGQYAAGVAGPDRMPNTFGAFSLTIDTKPPVAATVIEKQTTLEKIVSVDKTSKLLKLSLGRTPFSSRTVVNVNLTEKGKTAVIGEGFTFGKRLWVVVPSGTTLSGSYTLRRTSGSKKLAKTKTVTISSAAPAKTKNASREEMQSHD